MGHVVVADGLRRINLSRFIFLSALFHLAVMVLLSSSWFNGLRDISLNREENAKPIEVEFVNGPTRDVTTQIVETTLKEKSQEAARRAYLGQQTQTVEHQTRAKTTAPFRDGKRASGAKIGKQKIAIGDLGVKMNLQPMGHLGPGEIPSTSDYLTEVKPGAQTLLNTREFAFFSFYQRVRHQLEQYWEPGLRKRLRKMFDRGRRLAAEQEHSTRILVVLNEGGTITRIQVEGTSGFLDLDQAAVDAFNKAGPFPNPPKAMVDRDGTVKVEWEFVLRT